MIVATDYACPYCGEMNVCQIDTSGGDYETVEDCTVCCRPILIRAECEPGEVLSMLVERS